MEEISRIEKILVPADFSPGAGAALRYAGKLAATLSCGISLLHVVHTPESAIAETLLTQLPPQGREEEYQRKMEQWASQKMVSFLRHYLPDTTPEEIILRSGVPYTTISRVAESFRADIVIMGTHGEGRDSILLGSVAERVVHISQLPVMLVRPENFMEILSLTWEGHRELPERDPAPTEFAPPQNVLWPTDLSVLSNSILPPLSSLTRPIQPRLTILYVRSTEPQDETGQMSKKEEKAALSHLKEKAVRTGAFGPVDIAISTGVPFFEILRISRTKNIHLIAMATHGRTGAPRVLLGSTTWRVIRKAICPVLTVRGIPGLLIEHENRSVE